MSLSQNTSKAAFEKPGILDFVSSD